MNSFYTNFRTYGNSILIRGFKDGKRYISKEKFKPTLYALANNTVSKYKSLFDENLKQHKFEDINGAKEFVKKYQHVHNFKIFGNTSYHFQWCQEIYPGIIEYDASLIRTTTLDIETTVGNQVDEDGNPAFPDYFDPMEKITLITCIDRVTKFATTFGCWDYKSTRENSSFIRCKDEADLYMKFLAWWEKEEIDVITGWNTDDFDIPYLCERMLRIVGQDNAKRLSPFGIIKSREFDFMGKKKLSYEIYGIASLDYLELYKKFMLVKQESYKLDHIGEVELGMKKLSNPYATFKEFYEKDEKLFTVYNIRDCDIVDNLENKLKLIELAFSMGFMSHINFDDVYSPVKMWDTIIYNYLIEKNIVPPLKEDNFGEDKSIEGAFVKEPIPGLYRFVASFDLAGLYPHIIMAGNMSPETLFPTMADVNVQGILSGDRSQLKDGFSLTANGSMYDMSKKGFLAELMFYYYNLRKIVKKEMQGHQSKLELLKSEISRRETAKN